jgi:hypothetical protein
MALDTVRRKTSGYVVRSLRSYKIISMATKAIGWRTRELLLCGVGVTGLATECGVPAEQRKTCCLVFLYHVGKFPALRCMTSQAIRAQLTFVHIGVTGETVHRLLWELQPFMTRNALERLVLTGQCKTGVLMFERCISSHLPRVGRVTRAALETDFAVRRFLCEYRLHDPE